MIRNLTERRDFGGIVIVALVGAAIAVKLLTSSTSGGSSPAPVAAQAAIHLSGSGTLNTAPFQLAGGDYVVSWSAADTGLTTVGCYHSASLYPTSGDWHEIAFLGSGDVAGGQTLTGSTYAYGVAAGTYYVNASSGCDWTVDLSR
jgi:ABC-type antimicrobial peptide transport system permease subunit